MQGHTRMRRPTAIDVGWQFVYRIGFPLAKTYWRLRRQHHEGALVAVYVGETLLLLRSPYRAAWNFPGGTVRRGEAPELAARRELREEIGLSVGELRPVGSVWGKWEGRRDWVHIFELHLDELPELQLDHREIIGARLVSPRKLGGFLLTAPVAAYLNRAASPGNSASESCQASSYAVASSIR